MKQKLFSAFILLFAALLLFSSCSNIPQENETARELTEQFIDAVIANNPDAAYAVLAKETDPESFSQVFPQIVGFFDGVESYTLEQTGWHTALNNGIQTTTMTYSVETDHEKVLIVKSTFVEGYDGLYRINFNDTGWIFAKISDLSPLNIGLIIFSIVAIAFSVWMLVDCIKRKVNKKPLWIILILLGINLTLTMTPELLNFRWAIGLFLKLSGVTANIDQNSLAVGILIPVGAIIYFFIRKRITKKETQPNVIEGTAVEIPDDSKQLPDS